MNMYLRALPPFALLIAAAVAAGCVPGGDPGGDPAGELAGSPGTEEEDVGEAADAITSNELSTLLMGSSFTVTQGYLPNGTHAGIDFGGTGDGVTSVKSPVYGTITAKTSACGKVAIFDGTNTLIFAHMTSLTSLAVGTSISTGTYLGKASQVIGGGCTATGPHLHLEIRTGNNTNMALPTANNTATTLNPLTYQYGPFSPVPLVSPADGASVAGNPITFKWSSVQGASTYRLQIAGSGGFSGDTCVGACVFNNTTAGTQMGVTLPSAGVYYWRVRAGSSYSGGYWSPSRKVVK